MKLLDRCRNNNRTISKIYFAKVFFLIPVIHSDAFQMVEADI